MIWLEWMYDERGGVGLVGMQCDREKGMRKETEEKGK